MASSNSQKPFIFYRYVLKEHVGPFLFALTLIVFLFLMNYTLREAGKLFGRGLDAIIVFKLFYYHLAPTISLAIPMSVLVSTAMAFVRIAADSEITILRSSGVNLNRILKPLLVFAVFISLFVFYFHNTVLPRYNVESAALAKEVSRLKPTFNLYPNTFTDIKDIKLFVKEIDDSFNNNRDKKIEIVGEDKADYPVDHLFNVVIYDKRVRTKPRTTIAKEGYVFLNPVNEVFEFILLDGEIHEADMTDPEKFQRSFFKKTIFLMNASDYVMDETDPDNTFKSNRAKDIFELDRDINKEYDKIMSTTRSNIDRFHKNQIRYASQNKSRSVTPRFSEFTPFKSEINDSIFNTMILSSFNKFIELEYKNVSNAIRVNEITMSEINDLKGEWHKKFAIPFASIVFVLIGAPLGMMTRKGEAGKAAMVCLIVFILYYIGLILGEELSEDGKVIPVLGIWSGNIAGMLFAITSFFLLFKEKSIADISFSGVLSIFKRDK